MIITISGKPGSGKSTVAKEVAKKLGLKHYSVGDLWREMAKDKGISILEFNKLVEKDKDIDIKTDNKLADLGKREDNFVIDSRLAFHFIPHSIKVFLEVDDDTGAERIFKQKREDEKYATLEKTKEEIRKREKSETKRYKELYEVGYLDKSGYDIVIDSGKHNVQEISDKIVQFARKQVIESEK